MAKTSAAGDRMEKSAMECAHMLTCARVRHEKTVIEKRKNIRRTRNTSRRYNKSTRRVFVCESVLCSFLHSMHEHEHTQEQQLSSAVATATVYFRF